MQEKENKHKHADYVSLHHCLFLAQPWLKFISYCKSDAVLKCSSLSVQIGLHVLLFWVTDVLIMCQKTEM